MGRRGVIPFNPRRHLEGIFDSSRERDAIFTSFRVRPDRVTRIAINRDAGVERPTRVGIAHFTPHGIKRCRLQRDI